MTDKPFPPDLREWATTTLRGLDTITDVSWARHDSQVWQVAHGPSTSFVKRAPSSDDFDREVAGYRHAARALTGREAPRLLAAHRELRALISTALPGKIVRHLSLDQQTERRVHRNAGALLRRWHDASDQPSDQDRATAQAAILAGAREARECLTQTAERLTKAESELVQAASSDLPDLSAQLPVIYQHGDYSTRNWLWDADTGQYGVIDFAMADYGYAVAEFVWLYGALWTVRPDLQESYLEGYGRPLSGTEKQMLLLLTARLGVSYLNTGVRGRRPDLVDRGHLILTRLAARR